MRYAHRFPVQAPSEAVVEFHRHLESLIAITPPPLRLEVKEAPPVLVEGSEIRFELRFGPLVIPWHLRIEAWSPTGFVDRQLDGPFRSWVHRHAFRSRGLGRTEVVDEIEASLRAHPWWGPIGLAMWLTLPLLFAYRARRTRAQLERGR